MKWSWKSFGLHLLGAFGLALAFSYLFSLWIEANQEPGSKDATHFSMLLGGFTGPAFLATIGGWKLWSQKSLRIVTLVVGLLFAGGGAVVSLILSECGYHVGRQLKRAACYYWPPERADY